MKSQLLFACLLLCSCPLTVLSQFPLTYEQEFPDEFKQYLDFEKKEPWSRESIEEFKSIVEKDKWKEVVLSDGVVWRSRVYENLFDGVQTVNVLDVDLSANKTIVPMVSPPGVCVKTSQFGIDNPSSIAVSLFTLFIICLVIIF